MLHEKLFPMLQKYQVVDNNNKFVKDLSSHRGHLKPNNGKHDTPLMFEITTFREDEDEDEDENFFSRFNFENGDRECSHQSKICNHFLINLYVHVLRTY